MGKREKEKFPPPPVVQETPQVARAAEPALPDLPVEFKRPAWLHYSRYVAIVGLLLIDGVICSQRPASVQIMNMAALGKAIISYVLLALCNVMVLPGILLETNRIQITEDNLVISNLLWRSTIPWADIKAVKSPLYLKFAIVRTPKCFYLINKRDYNRFVDLIHLIQVKSGKPSK